MGGVLLGLPHVMPAQSPPAYGGVSSLLQLPHGSQLLASAGSSSSPTQSRLVLSLCPSHLPSVHRNNCKYTDTLPPYKGARMGSIWRYGLRPQRQVTRHGQTIHIPDPSWLGEVTNKVCFFMHVLGYKPRSRPDVFPGPIWGFNYS